MVWVYKVNLGLVQRRCQSRMGAWVKPMPSHEHGRIRCEIVADGAGNCHTHGWRDHGIPVFNHHIFDNHVLHHWLKRCAFARLGRNSPFATCQSSSQPASQPASQPTNQPTNQPTSQPASQPASQAASQAGSQLTSQAARQPTN